jgi:Histidine kinase-, DNA gyrase B-, and HSP90-like ATPase
MKSVKATPGAKRLIESLRNLGYECSTAIADLVDNSIAANASEIHIEIFAQHGEQPAAVLVADNGRGMGREQLQEAMRFGASQEYAPDDLGKYGLGLKTASLSQCRTLTVSSKAKSGRDSRPRRQYARWDIEHVYSTDDWDLLAPTSEELEDWEREALEHESARDHGTVILWTNLEDTLGLLSSHNVRQRERFLAALIGEVSAHLRMVFHRFMQGSVTGRRRLNIYVAGEKLEPWDPFCRDEKKTREIDIAHFDVTGRTPDGAEETERVTVTPYVLPREDEFSNSAAWKAASGPKNWNQQQGFYFYRNNRLLQAGGWSWLRAPDEHTKLLRVAVDFPSGLDRAFAINITKMRARIPAEIREAVANDVSVWVKAARERYDRKPASSGAGAAAGSPRGGTSTPAADRRRGNDAPPAVQVGPLTFLQSNTPSQTLTIISGTTPGHVRVLVPRNHEFAEIFTFTNGEDGLRKLCLAALSVLEAVHERRIPPDRIPIAALKKALRRYSK